MNPMNLWNSMYVFLDGVTAVICFKKYSMVFGRREGVLSRRMRGLEWKGRDRFRILHRKIR